MEGFNMKISKQVWYLLAATALILIVVGCTSNNNENNQANQNDNNDSHLPPSIDDLDPDDPMTEAIKYGEEIFNETNVVLPENVGNELSCQSCHADGGLADSSSLVGV